MDTPEQVLALVRDTLGCNGVRNFFDFAQLRQDTLERRIERVSKELTSLNKVSICVVWLMERMLRTNKAARRQVVEEWVNYESCLNYRTDSVGRSSTFNEDMQLVEDEIVRQMETLLERRSRRRTTTAEGGTLLFSQDEPSYRRRDRRNTDRCRGQHYSPPRGRHSELQIDKDGSMKDNRDDQSSQIPDSPSPKKVEYPWGIKQKESLSALKEPRPTLPLGSVHTLTGLLNQVYDKKSDDVDVPSENSQAHPGGRHGNVHLDGDARKMVHGGQKGPNKDQCQPTGQISRRLSMSTANIGNLKLLSAKSFEPNQKLFAGGSGANGCGNYDSYLNPYETQPAELPGIDSEQNMNGSQSSWDKSSDVEPSETARTPVGGNSSIRRANEFLNELGSTDIYKRKYETFENDMGISASEPELAPKRVRGTEWPDSDASKNVSASDDTTANGMNAAEKRKQTLYHPFIAAVKRVYGGVFRKKPERKTALEIWEETGPRNDNAPC